VEIQTVRLDKETLVALRKIAEKQERTVGWLIRKAVEDFVARDKGGKH
jgi:predicted transcriptional regulator